MRAWITSTGKRFVPPANASDVEIVRIARAWHAARADAGYTGFGLPESIGGRPGALIEEIIFLQEQANHPMGRVEIMTLGTGMAIPTILAHGTPEHLEMLGRKTLRGDIIWCQLFSEPGAGSDLAGIRTSAVREGDDWIVNGQKVWTSGAFFADWGLLLTRSDPSVPKHRGLTYFLLDMRTPGVEVRPLKQLGGRSEFNEVFLTDVRIPEAASTGRDSWRLESGDHHVVERAAGAHGRCSRRSQFDRASPAPRITRAGGRWPAAHRRFGVS